MLSSIETRRLMLRQPTLGDAASVHACVSRHHAAVARLIALPDELPGPADLAALLEEMNLPVLAIFDRAGVLVGAIAFRPLDEPRVWSIDTWIAADQRGHGYATEAVAALARALLRNVAAARVEIYVHPDHVRASRLPRRVGFDRAGQGRARARGPLLERWVLADASRVDRWAPSIIARDEDGDELDDADDVATEAWDLICRYVVDNLTPKELTDERITIAWPTAGGPSVEVTATLSLALGRPWIVITAAIDAPLAMRDALARNADLALGALVLKDERYLIRHAAPLEATPGWVLRQTMELLAYESARLRASVQTVDVRAFANFAD